MSVSAIKLPESWPTPKLQGSPELPREIWATILNFFLSNSSSFVHLKGIVSAAGTCQFFHKFLWHFSQIEKFPKSLQVSPLLAKITQLKWISSAPHAVPFSFSYQYWHDGVSFYNLLAIGPGGKQYFADVENNGLKIHILEFLQNDEIFHVTSLDIQNPAEGSKPTIIIACHPFENGFIVVFNSGFSKWKYLENFPIFQNTYCHNAPIEASAYKNDILYLRENGSKWMQINIKEENFAVTEINRKDPRLPTEVFINPQGNVRLDSESNLFYLDIQKQGKRFLSFMDEERALTLLGEKENIQPVNPSKGEAIFVTQGLLFASYSDGTFRSIFLPTKEEFTSVFSPLFDPYLKNGRILRATFFNPKERILEALFLTTRTLFDGSPLQTLSQVRFRIDRSQNWEPLEKKK